MKTTYIYYTILAFIVVAIGVVVALLVKGKGANETVNTYKANQPTGAQSTPTNNNGAAPCSGTIRTSWMNDDSIRPGYVRITYCDGTEEVVPGLY